MQGYPALGINNVRGRDVFVVQSLYTGDSERINDRLVKLLIAIGSLKNASPGRITPIIPYLGYPRQDRYGPDETKWPTMLPGWVPSRLLSLGRKADGGTTAALAAGSLVAPTQPRCAVQQPAAG